MKPCAFSVILYLLLIVFTTSCATSRYPSDDRSPYPRERDDKHKRDKDDRWEQDDRREHDRDRRESDGRIFPFRDLRIPKGHLPPPGECKVWFPGKPPGHQPPPQSCASALRSVPLGAWVITHEGSRYRVSIFDKVRRGVLNEVRYYMAQ